MASAVRLREDYSPDALRRLAARSTDANQSRRLLSLAAVLDGMSRTEAARIGGMDRQTLRDWGHRFNQAGPDGLFDHWDAGPPAPLSEAQRQDLARSIEAGPDWQVDGVVRWRRIDLQRVVKARFGGDDHERHISKLLRKMGFAHMSARPEQSCPPRSAPVHYPCRAWRGCR